MVSLVSLFLFTGLQAQNLLFNGGFEDVKTYDWDTRRNRDTFYAKHWYEATNATVDIIRDSGACNDAHTKSVEPSIDFCTKAKSGNYCIGMGPLTLMGYMEHISGRLKDSLKEGQKYLVSFYLKKQPTKTPLIPKGIGLKFHQDSVLFSGQKKDIDNHKVWAHYDNLFEREKIFSDFEIDEYVLDTNWVEYQFIYSARGGEKYLTIGRFAYDNDEGVMKQFRKLRHAPWEGKILRFIRSDKSKTHKRFFDEEAIFDSESSGYYFIDQVRIIPLDSTKPPAKEVVTEDNTIPEEAYNYVDLDPATAIPSERQIVIDKGFVGDLKLELGVRLKPMEKYVLEYGRRNQIVIINTAEGGGYGQMKFFLEHPARKLRKKPVRFYVEKTNSQEIETLKSAAEKIEQLAEPNFEGIVLKSRSQ